MRQMKYESPKERLENLRNLAKRKRSLSGLRTAMSEAFHCKPSDMREFSYKIGNHRWRGIIYHCRNSLMGTLLSFFDTELVIIRGYPKIRYALSTKVLNKECVCQEKMDGSCIGIFRLPDGTIHGKTRLTAEWRQMVFKSKELTYQGLVRETRGGKTLKALKNLFEKKKYIVYGELFGMYNPGDFIKYPSTKIDYLVFDIVDRETLTFLSPQRVKEVCKEFHLPMVKEVWGGVLTPKEIERMEFQLRSEIKEDGNEGFVAKTVIDGDVFRAKLKCEEIREQCWKRTGKVTIPKAIIRKAIRKTFENFPGLSTVDAIFPYVKEELEEEVTKELIEEVEHRIRGQIHNYLSPSDIDLEKLMTKRMLELQSLGMDLHDKHKVLSSLCQEINNVNSGKLFWTYSRIILRMDKK